jgi:hypothetical protein
MTLGHVYDLDLKKNETVIKEVIVQAQGEVNSSFSRLVIRLINGFRWLWKNISSKSKKLGQITLSTL